MPWEDLVGPMDMYDIDSDGDEDIYMNYRFAQRDSIVFFDSRGNLIREYGPLDRHQLIDLYCFDDIDGDGSSEVIIQTFNSFHLVDGEKTHIYIFNNDGSLHIKKLISENWNDWAIKTADINTKPGKELLVTEKEGSYKGEPVESILTVYDKDLKKLHSYKKAENENYWVMKILDVDDDDNDEIVIYSRLNGDDERTGQRIVALNDRLEVLWSSEVHFNETGENFSYFKDTYIIDYDNDQFSEVVTVFDDRIYIEDFNDGENLSFFYGRAHIEGHTAYAIYQKNGSVKHYIGVINNNTIEIFELGGTELLDSFSIPDVTMTSLYPRDANHDGYLDFQIGVNLTVQIDHPPYKISQRLYYTTDFEYIGNRTLYVPTPYLGAKLGDVNNDGSPEYLKSKKKGHSTEYVYVQTENESQLWRYPKEGSHLEHMGHMVADLDGDGNNEILVVTSKGGVNINPGFELVAFDGTGKVIWKTDYEKPWGLQIIVLIIMICIMFYILFSSRYKMKNLQPPDDEEEAQEGDS